MENMEDLFYVLFIMTVLAVFLWVVYFVMKSKENAQNNAQPVQTGVAKLVDMQRISAGEIAIGDIWTMFELEDGTRIRLEAKPRNTLVVGDRGILIWQGNKILKFERNKEF